MLRIKIEDTSLYEYIDGTNRTWSYEKFLTNSKLINESNWSRISH